MTLAVLVAGLAGIVAAAGLVELAAARSDGSRGPQLGALARLIRSVARRSGVRRAGSARGLVARVDAAGVGVSAAELTVWKLAAAPVTALAIAPLAPPGRLGLVALLLGPPLGFFAPDLWLRARTRERRRTIEAEQADVLDLLRVAVGAGLGTWRAMAEVGRRHPGVLASELGATVRRADVGLSRDAALMRLESRCPAAGMHALVAALRRADRFGAPPGPTLAALAEEARARHARRAVEHAARAAPKIQLVVALLLVPSVLLLVAAALVPALTGASL